MNKRLLVILIIFLLNSSNVHSQFLQYSNEFLNIGAGARALGMGGAQICNVQDATAGYWNPAGLAYIKDRPEVDLMHAEYFEGIGKYDFFAMALPVQNNKRTLGITLLRFAVDDIPNTLYLVQPDGSINYNNITTFSSADYALLLSLGQTIKENNNIKITAGANAKIIYRKVGTFANALGFGFDAGIQIKGKRWFLGAVAKDITTTFNAWSFNFSQSDQQVLYLTDNQIPVKSTELTAPSLIVGGGNNFKISHSLDLRAETNLALTFNGEKNNVVRSNSFNIDPRAGLELSLKNIFFFRVGVSNFQKGLADGDTFNQRQVWIFQPSIGAGFRINNVTIDYAFTNLANQSSPLYTNVFSIKVGPIKKINKSKK